MAVVFVYVMTPNDIEAKKIGHAIVADRLAACANIIPGVTSIYHWEGKLEEAQETTLILKTRAELYPALEARVRELHSYETPCIAALPVSVANAPYTQWILDETKP